MRYVASVLIALLLPVAAVAQPAADTLDYSRLGEQMPDDLNCGGFVSQQDANRWYGRAQVYFGEIDQYQLDGDNDGQPCEGLDITKRERMYEGVWVDYRLTPYRVKCQTTQESFGMQEYIDQAHTALTDSVGYLQEGGLLNRAECLHNISQYQSQ